MADSPIFSTGGEGDGVDIGYSRHDIAAAVHRFDAGRPAEQRGDDIARGIIAPIAGILDEPVDPERRARGGAGQGFALDDLGLPRAKGEAVAQQDRKSTRLNSS